MTDSMFFPALAVLAALPLQTTAQTPPGAAAAPAAKAAPAPAAPTPAADANSTARIAAARTLIGTLRTEQQMRGQQALAGADGEAALDRMIPAQVAMRAQLTDPQGYARARAEAVKLIVDDRQRTAEETIPLMVEAEVRRYAAHYTVDELRGIDAFYRSPLGQRVVAEQPKLATDSVQFQQNVLAPILAAHAAALIPKLQVAMGPVLRQAAATATPAPATPQPPGKKK